MRRSNYFRLARGCSAEFQAVPLFVGKIHNVLELQEARHGSHTEAGVLLEIRDLRAALVALDARLAELAAQPPATTLVPAAIAPPAAPPAFANPFTPGVVVPPDRFMGRAYELRTILARLENLLSVSIVRVCPPGQPLPRHPPKPQRVR